MFTQQRPRVTDRSMTTDPFFDSDLFVHPLRRGEDNKDSYENEIASRVSEFMLAEQGVGGGLQKSQMSSAAAVPRTSLDSPTSSIKFVHSSYEYLSGIVDGKTFEKEEKVTVNEVGEKSHIVKRAINGASSISTWTCPPGALESSCAHVVSFSDNANRDAFERTWHQKAPFELRDDEDEEDSVQLLEKEKGDACSSAWGGGKGQALCPPPTPGVTK
jgi:hypothetical protein